MEAGNHDPEAELAPYSEQDRSLAAALVEQHYDRLTEIARSKRLRAGVGDTMRTTDLLHDSWLRLEKGDGWQSDEHFIRAATLAMRHAIIDYARRKQAEKRGNGQRAETLDPDMVLDGFSETPEQVVAIGQLMERLEAANPRWMRIVDARYFAGMTEDETAEVMRLSTRTVRREWQAARSWIGRQLGVVA